MNKMISRSNTERFRFPALHRLFTSFVVQQETLAADIVGSVRERQQVGHIPTCAGGRILTFRQLGDIYSHPWQSLFQDVMNFMNMMSKMQRNIEACLHLGFMTYRSDMARCLCPPAPPSLALRRPLRFR